MSDATTYSLRIAGKRQVTIPEKMLKELHLDVGDTIRVEVVGSTITKCEPCKEVPTRLFNPDVLRELDRREREMDAGKFKRFETVDDIFADS